MWKKISKVWIFAALFVFAALPALAASPLTIGSRGDEVRSIQQILRSKGYRVNVNGVYTNDTARAVSQYQKDKKIQVSGKVGGWTYYLLTGNRSMLPPKPVMKMCSGTTRESAQVMTQAKGRCPFSNRSAMRSDAGRVSTTGAGSSVWGVPR